MLTPRQERILGKVVEEYLHTGQPVPSRAIAADPDLDCGPSTVRNELAFLEEYQRYWVPAKEDDVGELED